MSGLRSRFGGIQWPVGIILVGPVILLGRFLINGQALYWGLPLLQFIPWQAEAFEQIKSGIIPFWNPLSGMGSPLLANYQLALFYPATWCLFIFYLIGSTAWLAWGNTLVMFFHLIWAGIGAVLTMERIGLGRLNQAIAGLAFSLSAFLVSRLGFSGEVWVAAWLPWVIWSISGKRFLPIVICLTFQLLAGHAQLAWYSILFAVGWTVVWGWYRARWDGIFRSLLRLLAAGILAGLLAAIQLVPTAEYLAQSQRGNEVDYETALSYSFSPYHLINFIVPDFWGNPGLGNYIGNTNYWENAGYVGVMPLIFALTSLIFVFKRRKRADLPDAHPDESTSSIHDAFYDRGRKQSQYQANRWLCFQDEVPRVMDTPGLLVGFLWITAVGGFILALGKFSPVFPLLFRHIPTFNMFNGPARFLLWTVFSLALLAGIGAQNFGMAHGRGLYWLRMGSAGAGAMTAGAFLVPLFGFGLRPGVSTAVAAAGFWGLIGGIFWLIQSSPKVRTSQPWLTVGLVFVVFFDLLTAVWWLNPAAEIQLFAIKSDLSQKFMFSESGSRLYLPPADEYEIKYNRLFRFDDFGHADKLKQAIEQILPNTHLLQGVPSINNFDPLIPGRYYSMMRYIGGLDPFSRESWLRLMNVGVVEKLSPSSREEVVFEILPGASRFSWSDCVIFTDDESSTWAELVTRMSGHEKPPLILEGKRGVDSQSNRCTNNGMTTLEILEDQPVRLSLWVKTSQDGFLMTADTWYPGWKATIDSQPVQMYRSDYIFRAVELPAGQHLVEFAYQPWSFHIGAVLSLTGLVLVTIIILMHSKWRNEHK
jgi:hypothetical protein